MINKDLIIAVMNGAAGFFEKYEERNRLYMSDIVWQLLQKYLPTYKEWNIEYNVKKGGIWFLPDLKIKKFIELRNHPRAILLMIGKSYGCYDLSKIINKEGHEWNFRHKIMFSVDACSPLKLIKKDWKINYKNVDTVYNYYQKNNKLLSGAKAVVNETCKLYEKDITKENLDHFDIIFSKTIKKDLSNLLKSILE